MPKSQKKMKMRHMEFCSNTWNMLLLLIRFYIFSCFVNVTIITKPPGSGADYSIQFISIETYEPQYIGHNNIFLGSVLRSRNDHHAIAEKSKHKRHKNCTHHFNQGSGEYNHWQGPALGFSSHHQHIQGNRIKGLIQRLNFLGGTWKASSMRDPPKNPWVHFKCNIW